MIRLRPLVKGILTFIPGVRDLLPRRPTGGTDSASYCYGIWLKHLTLLWENGLRSMPGKLAELGPGDSLGVGLAALLSGVEQYRALDVVRYSNSRRNLAMLDALLGLLRSRAPRPSRGWPDFDRHLDGGLFPSHILTGDLLRESLSDERVALIRRELADMDGPGRSSAVDYRVPWFDEDTIEKGTVDVILSHSVLEHVTDLETTYRALSFWLKPGGMMSHQVDFTSHGVSREWNGYWACPERLWTLAMGKRPFLINRRPCSAHIDLMERNGFQVVCLLKKHRVDGIRRSRLAARWSDLSDDDLNCSGIFVQARKRLQVRRA